MSGREVPPWFGSLNEVLGSKPFRRLPSSYFELLADFATAALILAVPGALLSVVGLAFGETMAGTVTGTVAVTLLGALLLVLLMLSALLLTVAAKTVQAERSRVRHRDRDGQRG